ncbi:hypothetical protein IFM89_025860 [Coptis chinensis]|uniref:Uncharacterized protein n=1 Tax=Coptis chinensis TaxID=261450 RepID=A0A835LX98_9MAGN|nr:hypothetical protein IFM89_025860 [Coptis chinensis]
MLMKLALSIENEDIYWAKFMKGKYINQVGLWSKNKDSTVWNGIIWALQEMRKHQGWVARNGQNINLWLDNWACDKNEFNMTSQVTNLAAGIQSNKNMIPLVLDIWKASVVTSLVTIWKNRNRVMYDKGRSSYKYFCFQIRKSILRAYNMSSGYKNNSVRDLAFLHKWRLQGKYKEVPKEVE